jgi:O-methyltransferase
VRFARRFWVRYLRHRITDPLHQNRIRTLWFLPGYWRLLVLPGGPAMFAKFLRIDWRVLHAHRPGEIAHVVRALSRYRGGAMVEAGCWNGGSTAKFSLACARYGHALHVYDSFQGVEAVDEGGYDFAGEYAAALPDVQKTVERYGEASACSFHPGWFAETMPELVPERVNVVFIDCDRAKGTREVLDAVLPRLDGLAFSQDYAIRSVRNLLDDPRFQAERRIEVVPLSEKLALIKPVRTECNDA